MSESFKEFSPATTYKHDVDAQPELETCLAKLLFLKSHWISRLLATPVCLQLAGLQADA